jgi:hypothetical protein
MAREIYGKFLQNIPLEQGYSQMLGYIRIICGREGTVYMYTAAPAIIQTPSKRFRDEQTQKTWHEHKNLCKNICRC